MVLLLGCKIPADKQRVYKAQLDALEDGIVHKIRRKRMPFAWTNVEITLNGEYGYAVPEVPEGQGEYKLLYESLFTKKPESRWIPRSFWSSRTIGKFGLYYW